MSAAGGGDGGVAGGLLAVGGSGSQAGKGGTVNVTNDGALATTGNEAPVVIAQSIGGGGGSGGGAVAVGPNVAIALGGSGGAGGDGGTVNVRGSATGSLTSGGAGSHGIQAQSVGGGGGNGGFAVAGSAGKGASVSFALGGSGAAAGKGGTVDVDTSNQITTGGQQAHGVFAQSVGGGGGSGGFSIAASGSNGVAASIALGGKGSKGGDGGTVDVTTRGTVNTTGDLSSAVFAQSVGGGGGDGGFSVAASGGKVAASFGLGGKGGGGGDGQSTTVLNTGTLQTSGWKAHGIRAESIGGGGGSGGFSVGASVSEKVSGALAIGGEGGTASKGGKVTVTNQGAIVVTGFQSKGVTASSIGGGGGDGGFSVAASIAKNGALAGAVGGRAGGGGDGDEVNVTNQGSIQTAGTLGTGVYAQSLGGGGGSGGFAVSGAASKDQGGSFAASVGGSGGMGGKSKLAQVVNSGTIVTTGALASGIEAESTGGGGGQGGFAVAGTFVAKPQQNGKTFDLTVAVGGAGGTGSTGGTAQVTNTGGVDTSGWRSHGLVSRSTGGGGGSAGMTGTIDLGLGGSSSGASVAVGQDGGSGGMAGLSTITNQGNVITRGDDAYGLHATSVGGSGGEGGATFNLTGDFSGSASGGGSGGGKGGASNKFNAAVTVGGSGGTGGHGGTVNLTNSGSVITLGHASTGVSAQSVGGGGGIAKQTQRAALDFSTMAPDPKDKSRSLDVDVTVGGSGGAAGDGGDVTVNNTGSVDTSGDFAHGVHAESIGGGGGRAGSLSRDTLSIAPPSKSTLTSRLPNLKPEGAVAVNVGGDNGASGDGGIVMVNQTGSITTRGMHAFGIFAESIGGGGGSAAVSSDQVRDTGSGVLDILGSDLTPKTLTVNVGGDGGADGDGKAVTVTHTGSITTFGYGSVGIKADSIGGGGGSQLLGPINAPSVGTGLTGEFTLGGAGGAGGDGGDVTVNLTGNLNTFGDLAHGIQARSIGGGGGTSGSLDRSSVPGLEFGLGVGMLQAGGNAGDGGAVTLLSKGRITTRGARAHGIYAQSVGGGGGELGNAETGITFHGSVGGDGRGGDITVTHTGSIDARGRDAYGIFAQSAGDDGDANTPLDLTRAGDISITVQRGTIMGGSGQGAGIFLSGGNDNTVLNRGTIGARSGMAILGTTGNDTVTNAGTLMGNVDLGGGTNALVSLPGSSILLGRTLNMNGGTLQSNGLLTFQGQGPGRRSRLIGSLALGPRGTYQVAVHPDGRFDHLRVTGTAKLAGRIQVDAPHGLYRDGTRYEVLRANQGVKGSFGRVDVPAALPLRQFRVLRGGKDVTVRVDVEPFASVAAQPFQRDVAEYLDELAPESEGEVRDLLADIQGLPEVDQLTLAYGTMSPVAYDDATRASERMTRAHSQNLEQRLRETRQDRRRLQEDRIARQETPQDEEGQRPDVAAGPTTAGEGVALWATPFGFRGDQSEVDGIAGTDFRGHGVSFGLDRPFGENTILGVAGGFADTDLEMDDDFADADVRSWYASAYGTWYRGCLHIDGSASYAENDFDQDRLLIVGDDVREVRSSHEGETFAGRLSAGCEVEVAERVRIEPYAAVDYIRTKEDGFTERGAGVMSLRVDGRTSDAVLSEVGMRVGSRVPVGDTGTILAPELVAGWVHQYDAGDRDLVAGFSAAPGSSFVTTGRDVPDDTARVGLSLRLLGSSRVEGSIDLDSRFGNGTQEFFGSVQIGVRF